MVNRCVAYGCSNTPYTPNVSLHAFPKDPKLHRLWRRNVQKHRKHWKPSHCSMLCSAHFEKNEQNFHSEDITRSLLGLPRKRIVLKPTAVPTIFKNSNSETPKNRKTAKKRDRKRLHFKESDFVMKAKPAKLKANAIPSVFESSMKRKYVEINERVEVLEERVRILEAEKNALLLQLGQKVTVCKERGVQAVARCASKATQCSPIPGKSTAVQKQQKGATTWTSILKNPVTSHRPTAQNSLNKYKDEGTVLQTGQVPEPSDIKWDNSVENLVSPNLIRIESGYLFYKPSDIEWDNSVENLVSPNLIKIENNCSFYKPSDIINLQWVNSEQNLVSQNLLKIENHCSFYKPSETITPDCILPHEPCETVTAGSISLDEASETVTPNSSFPDAYLHIKIKEEPVD